MSPTKSTSTTKKSGADGEAQAPTRDYTLLRGSHTREEDGEMKTYSSRDPESSGIALTAEEARVLGDRVRLVEGQAPMSVEAQVEAALPAPELRQGGTGQPTELVTAEDQGTDTGSTGDWSHLSSLSWQDASAEIDGVTDAKQLDAAQKAEEEGKNRKSVLEAIDARREELKG